MAHEMAAKARPTIKIDNDRVRVIEYYFAPGAATGHHRHAHDYVVVPMTTGRLKLVEADGEREAQLTTGVPYTRQAGVEHDVVNVNDYPFVFIEIELK